MRFFKPSDIVTVRGVIQNLTGFGAAFAGTEDDESIFIPVRIAQQEGIDVGDSVTCYCIDQKREEHKPDKEVSARYRAMRLKVDSRFSDVMPGSAASAMMAEPRQPPKPPTPEITIDQANAVIGKLLKRRRAWTADDIIDEVKSAVPGSMMPQQMKEMIPKWLESMHGVGAIARCVVSSSAETEVATYYSVNEVVFQDLIEEYELDDADDHQAR